MPEDDKKALYQMLARLHLPDDADGIKVVDLKLLIDTLKKVA